MQKFCYSCGAPLSMPEFKSKAENYCTYCVNENAELKPKEEVKNNMAQFIKSWQPDIDDATALKRAEYYMLAMPAWAE